MAASPSRALAHSLGPFCFCGPVFGEGGRGLQRLTKRLERIKQVLLALAAPFIWAAQEAWDLLKQKLQPLNALAKRLRIRWEKALLRTRRLIAWTRILWHFGMQIVRDTAEQFFWRPV